MKFFLLLLAFVVLVGCSRPEYCSKVSDINVYVNTSDVATMKMYYDCCNSVVVYNNTRAGNNTILTVWCAK